MMKFRPSISQLTFVVAGFCCSTASGQGPAYRSLTELILLKCRAAVATHIKRVQQGDTATEALNNGNGSDGDGNYPGCMSDGKAQALAQFKDTARLLRKAAAKDALASYHATFVGALEGLYPAAGETRSGYALRQQDVDVKLAEKWARFELEAP